MAGDWLKVEVSLPDKPEVWRMAGILGADPDAVVGKLIKVWRWFDAHTESGNAVGVTPALVDSIAGVTGFADAMRLCGWLEHDGAILRLPHFDRHNGKTAKNRALTAKRAASFRANSNEESNATAVTGALPREEKRREEKKEQKPAPVVDLLEGINPRLAADFKALRGKLKAPITETALAGIRREAEKAGMTFEEALTMCCERGWRGFKAEWVGVKSAANEPQLLPRLLA